MKSHHTLPLRASLLATALLTSITTVASAQNVGIGTTTPKSKLSVNGTTASGGIAVGDATYTSTTGTVAPTNGAIIQGLTGIGTTTPLEKLHVATPVQNEGIALSLTSENNAIMLNSNNIGPYLGFIHNNADPNATLTAFIQQWGPTLGSGGANDLVYHNPTGDHVFASGNVGINTSTPQSRLDVRGTTKIMATGGTQTGGFWNGTSNVNGFEVTADTGSGDVYVGIQRAGALAPLHLAKPAGAVVGDPFLLFGVNGSAQGGVVLSATGVTYNTVSDERLKEHIRPSAKGLADVMKIQVSDYNYKSNPGHDETGFIAQQLRTVYPGAVTVGGEEATEKPWTVDYGRLTPVLVKAVQEQQAEIAALKAENEKLKAQVNKFDALAARMEAMEKSMAASTTSREETVRTVSLTK